MARVDRTPATPTRPAEDGWVERDPPGRGDPSFGPSPRRPSDRADDSGSARTELDASAPADARHFSRRVGAPEVIEPYGHVSNVRLAAWMDELAARLFARSATVAAGRAWFVGRLEIDFHAETLLGDEVLATAWIAPTSRLRATLHVRLVATSRQRRLASARSTWVLVDLATRRPLRDADCAWAQSATDADGGVRG